MWEELKQKLPMEVEWYSDSETGNGKLVNMDINEKNIIFYVDDSINVKIPFCSNRKYVGISVKNNKLCINCMSFEILII